MNIDFIVKGKPHRHIKTKGDTLYDDNKYLILGNAEKLGYYEPFGIFKKYKLLYKFSNFKVRVYKGRLAAPDFRTDPKAVVYRTQIKNQCNSEGINFAGHFTLTHWGCGSNCEDIAIVDRITGKIYYSNLFSLSNSVFFEVDYKPNSNMIIMNPWLINCYKGYIIYSDTWPLEVAKWDGAKFKFLLKPSL